jgi:hypothetical protein
LKQRSWLIDAAVATAIFAVNVLLNLPLFMRGDSPYRDSIELGYAGMARFVTENPSMWGWNPLQYCGLPVQFMYVPALQYATAAFSWISRGDPVYIYRLLTATAACLGPVTMYLFVRYFTKSRGWAAAAALVYTFFSPSYGLIRQVDRDRGLAYLPWRLHVLTKYGEGPHNAGLMLLPLAWISTWSAATRTQYWRIFACAVIFVLITLTNWVAGLALAFSSAMLLLAAYRAPDTPDFRYGRAIAAAGLAYLLACFWLTPSFIHTIAFNWPADAFNYKLQATQQQLLGGFAAGLLLVRLVAAWLRWPFFESFIALCVFGFGYVVVFFYSYGISTVPESRRYALEFEAFAVLTLIAFLRFCVVARNEIRLICATGVLAGLMIAGVPQIRKYVTQGWEIWKPVPLESTTEYQLAQEIASLRPEGRVLATGGLRFRMNAWHDLQQVGGSFESGLRNRTPVHFAYHIRTGQDTPPGLEVPFAIMEMKALGVEYVVVHGPKSDEHYRDYRNPRKFDGVLEKVLDVGSDEDDDFVYRVPYRGLAHLIRENERPGGAFRDQLTQYVAALEDPSRPRLSMRWASKRDIEITGPVPEGMLVNVLVTQDDGWEATQDGIPAAITRGPLGFMYVSARPAAQSVIKLHYNGTIEQRLMAVISGLAWISAVLALRGSRKRSIRPAPLLYRQTAGGV